MEPYKETPISYLKRAYADMLDAIRSMNSAKDMIRNQNDPQGTV